MDVQPLRNGTIEGVSKTLATRLSGTQITNVLQAAHLPQPLAAEETKWRRIHASVLADQQADGTGSGAVRLIEEVMDPGGWPDRTDFDDVRTDLNVVLAFAGLEIDAAGRVRSRPPAQTHDEIAVREASGLQGGRPIRLFASHLNAHRGFVGQVADALNDLGCGLFVAHASIPMDAPWQEEIEEELRSCDAGVAFIHPGFHDSYYCMQEVGWLLGRGIPVARLMFGETPAGLLGSIQGSSLLAKDPADVATFIVEWCMTRDALRGVLGESLSVALANSRSYGTTDRIWDQLCRVEYLTPSQVDRVLAAAESNNQVYGTGRGNYSGKPYCNVIADRASEWDTTGEFESRIARLCN